VCEIGLVSVGVWGGAKEKSKGALVSPPPPQKKDNARKLLFLFSSLLGYPSPLGTNNITSQPTRTCDNNGDCVMKNSLRTHDHRPEIRNHLRA